MNPRHSWRDAAACQGADLDVFFPDFAGRDTEHRADPAKRTCRVCPVRAACLAYALDNRIPDGVWGGLTPKERKALAPAPQRRSKGAAA